MPPDLMCSVNWNCTIANYRQLRGCSTRNFLLPRSCFPDSSIFACGFGILDFQVVKALS